MRTYRLQKTTYTHELTPHRLQKSLLLPNPLLLLLIGDFDVVEILRRVDHGDILLRLDFTTSSLWQTRRYLGCARGRDIETLDGKNAGQSILFLEAELSTANIQVDTVLSGIDEGYDGRITDILIRWDVVR